jgi:hypothetical protein
MNVNGGLIRSIDPYKGILNKNNVLKHSCGGDLKMFNIGGVTGEFSFAKPEKYRRERRKLKKNLASLFDKLNPFPL